MEQDKEKRTWGGARPGAGRKKTSVKAYYLRATQEVATILDRVEGSKSDFVNRCILFAHDKMGD